METRYELTHSELIKVFEKWDKEYLTSYAGQKITDTVSDAPKQAKEFARLVLEVQSVKAGSGN